MTRAGAASGAHRPCAAGLRPIQAKREAAQRLVAEAEAEAWRIHRIGQWVQTTADNGAMDRQPAPALVPPPKQFAPHLLRESLQRPWHKARPWNGAGAVAPRPTSDIVARRPRKVLA